MVYLWWVERAHLLKCLPGFMHCFLKRLPCAPCHCYHIGLGKLASILCWLYLCLGVPRFRGWNRGGGEARVRSRKRRCSGAQCANIPSLQKVYSWQPHFLLCASVFEYITFNPTGKITNTRKNKTAIVSFYLHPSLLIPFEFSEPSPLSGPHLRPIIMFKHPFLFFFPLLVCLISYLL